MDQQRNDGRDGDKRPAFARDDRMRVIHGWIGFCIFGG
jgi:hypothetical protein